MAHPISSLEQVLENRHAVGTRGNLQSPVESTGRFSAAEEKAVQRA